MRPGQIPRAEGNAAPLLERFKHLEGFGQFFLWARHSAYYIEQ